MPEHAIIADMTDTERRQLKKLFVFIVIYYFSGVEIVFKLFLSCFNFYYINVRITEMRQVFYLVYTGRIWTPVILVASLQTTDESEDVNVNA